MEDKELSFEMVNELINKRDAEEKKDRRKNKPDTLSRMATILSLGAWGVMLAVWVVVDMASPQSEFFWQSWARSQGHETILRTRYNFTMVNTAYILLLISIGMCLVAFVFNKMRMRRKGDKYKKSIFVIGGITITAFVFFMINFWRILF